jgi:hypothetical protein
MNNVKIGSNVKITSDNKTYNKWREDIWIVNDIARNSEEHQGFDECVGSPLISCEGLPVSLYEWEYEIV